VEDSLGIVSCLEFSRHCLENLDSLNTATKQRIIGMTSSFHFDHVGAQQQAGSADSRYRRRLLRRDGDLDNLWLMNEPVCFVDH